jgi:hypothetical protein
LSLYRDRLRTDSLSGFLLIVRSFLIFLIGSRGSFIYPRSLFYIFKIWMIKTYFKTVFNYLILPILYKKIKSLIMYI